MKALRRFDIDNYAPPGLLNVWSGVRIYVTLLIIAVITSLWTPAQICGEYWSLFAIDAATGEKYLIDRMMPRFEEMIGTTLFFWLAALYALWMMVPYAMTFRQESQSIYLMKRLPTRGEMFRRVAILPLLGLLISAVTCAGLYGLYYLMYLGLTPDGHLPL